MKHVGHEFAELIGVSAAIGAVRALIDRVASSGATVLVTGPSGSGKEVVARMLHQRGARAAAAFVAVNCGAVPAELIESEIFGHEAGAFTGAVKARRGRFELADNGTLFLDEVGDMPAAMQVKLLRVLETRVVERVGGMIGTAIDVRVVAATNVDLGAAVAAGRFREDLFYRLAVVEIAMPSLADRREDIAPLIDYFAAGATSSRRVSFSGSALAALCELPWRGNIRELRNFVDRAVAIYPAETIGSDTALDLAASVVRGLAPAKARRALPRSSEPEHSVVDLKSVLDAIEQDYIERALAHTAGAVAESARRLGLRRTTLIEKMRRLNISRMPAC